MNQEMLYRKDWLKKYEDQGFITDVIIPPSGKDFNEALLIQKKTAGRNYK